MPWWHPRRHKGDTGRHGGGQFVSSGCARAVCCCCPRSPSNPSASLCFSHTTRNGRATTAMPSSGGAMAQQRATAASRAAWGCRGAAHGVPRDGTATAHSGTLRRPGPHGGVQPAQGRPSAAGRSLSCGSIQPAAVTSVGCRDRYTAIFTPLAKPEMLIMMVPACVNEACNGESF